MASSEAANRRALELYETAPVGLCEVNDECVIIAMNLTLLNWLGYSQGEVIDRMSFAGLVTPGTRQQLNELRERCQQGKTVEGVDLNLRCHDGTRWFQGRVSAVGVHDAQGRFRGWRGSVRDVTWEREAQWYLRQMQTLEAIEALVEGIAHQLNNLLNIITAYAELGLEQIEPGLRGSSDLSLIKEAAFRAANVVRRLQLFSTHRILQKRSLDLDELLRDRLPTLRSLMPQNTELRLVTGAEGARVSGDPDSLTELVINVTAFAREVTPGGGTLSLQTRQVTLEEEYCQRHPAAKAGTYVALIASAPGVGTDPASPAHTFEPSFSTEQTGGGLRLSVVWGIVKQHDGYMDVSSSPDEGTIVRVYLPLNALYSGDGVATLRLNHVTMTCEMEGEGVPLLFIHEVATDHRLWTHQRTYFHTSYRVITVDVLGHGHTAWPEQQLSIAQAASNVQELIERLQIGPVFVIGVSMGAVVAMQVALNAPALVRGLILVSPWSTPNGHMRTLIDQLYRLAEASQMTAYVTQFLRYMFPAADLERPLPEVESLRALVLEQNPQVVAYAWAACLAVDLGARLSEIRHPSLVIAGLRDFFTPPYLARMVAAGLPDVELEVWEEAGHFPFLEDSVRFNRRLETFILRCLSQEGRSE